MNKNFAVVYSKKTRKQNKLNRKLKLFRSYETVELATMAVITDPILQELSKKYNIYIIEIVEEEE